MPSFRTACSRQKHSSTSCSMVPSSLTAMSSLSGRNSSSFMCSASRIQKRMGQARNLLRTEGEKASPLSFHGFCSRAPSRRCPQRSSSLPRVEDASFRAGRAGGGHIADFLEKPFYAVRQLRLRAAHEQGGRGQRIVPAAGPGEKDGETAFPFAGMEQGGQQKTVPGFFRLKESMPRVSRSSSGINWSETPPSGTVPSFSPVRMRFFSGRK